MAYKTSNPNGQATMANSEPVVLASDQSSIPVTGTFWQATQPVSIASAVPVTDNSGSLTVDAPVATPVFVRLSDGAAAITALPVTDNGSSLTVDGTVAATQSGTWTVQPGNTANTTPWLISEVPSTTGGLSKFHLVGAATTNATNVKASAGQVYTITAFNVSASPRYLKFHNTSGTPTAGSGVTDTYLIPGNTSGAGVVISIDSGIAFATGIGITITGGIADADTTAISASEVVVNIYYK